MEQRFYRSVSMETAMAGGAAVMIGGGSIVAFAIGFAKTGDWLGGLAFAFYGFATGCLPMGVLGAVVGSVCGMIIAFRRFRAARGAAYPVRVPGRDREPGKTQ